MMKIEVKENEYDDYDLDHDDLEVEMKMMKYIFT